MDGLDGPREEKILGGHESRDRHKCIHRGRFLHKRLSLIKKVQDKEEEAVSHIHSKKEKEELDRIPYYSYRGTRHCHNTHDTEYVERDSMICIIGQIDRDGGKNTELMEGNISCGTDIPSRRKR